MNGDYKVYVHICPNGKRYYGVTKQNPKERWRNGKGYRRHPRFLEAIQEFGWNNIEHIIVAKGLTKEEAYWLEIELIKAWNTTDIDNGYNIAKGGEGANGVMPSEETRKKQSEAKIGDKNPMYGMYGDKNPMYGKHPSEETKKKQSEANLGKNNPMYGKHHTKEAKKKLSKPVICLTTKRIFYSVTEGANYYNSNQGAITRCCQGKYKYCGKYNGQKLVWRYLVWNHNKVYKIQRN